MDSNARLKSVYDKILNCQAMNEIHAVLREIDQQICIIWDMGNASVMLDGEEVDGGSWYCTYKETFLEDSLGKIQSVKKSDENLFGGRFIFHYGNIPLQPIDLVVPLENDSEAVESWMKTNIGPIRETAEKIKSYIAELTNPSNRIFTLEIAQMIRLSSEHHDQSFILPPGQYVVAEMKPKPVEEPKAKPPKKKSRKAEEELEDVEEESNETEDAEIRKMVLEAATKG